MEAVLVTGAAGGIGTALRAGLAGRYRLLRLLDREPVADLGPGEEAVEADLADLAALASACAGVDAVVHLAAIPHEDAFSRILEVNVVGTYNVFEAARRAGVGRVVFASSGHVTGLYGLDEPVAADAVRRPDTIYGLSKCFGEDLGRLYHHKAGMAVACLRIGTFVDKPREERDLSSWLSPRDAVELVRCALEAPDLGFEVVYGASANTRRWWRAEAVERLGYHPVDDAEGYAADVVPIPPGEAARPRHRLQGGEFVELALPEV